MTEHCECCESYKVNHSFGWECPRCHTINSPYKLTCSCLPKVENASATNVKLTDMGEFGGYIIEIDK
jgi:hypothetical protein